MTANPYPRGLKLFSSIIAILVMMCGIGAFAFQEKISPLSDYQYKRDFTQYEAIKKRPTPRNGPRF